jgi:N-methylhydantoinase A
MLQRASYTRSDVIKAIGIDIGGTFVDVVLAGEDKATLVKIPSTPDAPHRGVLDGLKGLIERGVLHPSGVRTVAHGSTIATNALLEGKWARTALITTRGFRDVLEIGRQNRSDLYDLSVDRPDPIVPRDLRFELTERVDAEGRVVSALDPDEAKRLIPRLRQARVEAIAVVFLFSYLNPSHERLVGRLLAEALHVPVTLSSDVLPEFREYERTSTTVICAALRPVIGRYLGDLERGAGKMGLPSNWRIMQSSGTVTDGRNAEEEPVRILLSGPAAGVQGARAIGDLAGQRGLIAMDMGGTSCDVSLIRDGVLARTTSGSVGGHPIAQQMIGIHTIGAGGGSIAWIDSGGALRVGPRSAGALPGPACYGRGGRVPAVTDAHVVLGHLLPDFPLGGLPNLDVEAARAAIGTIAVPLSLSIEDAAEGILEIADAAMERAIRVISIERGHDPREYALLAFGGAGPLHAVSIAKRLSIPRVLVPATAGVLSALGLLTSEIGCDASRSVVRRLSAIGVEEVRSVVGELRTQGAGTLLAQGLEEPEIRFDVSADLRYAGQSHELNVPLLEMGEAEGPFGALVGAFHAEHETRFGHSDPDEEIELVTLRVRAAGPASLPGVPPFAADEALGPRNVMARFAGGGTVETRVLFRGSLGEGAAVEGPAIVVGSDATLLVPPGVSGRCDRAGTVLLEIS